MQDTKRNFRQFHRKIAPIVFLPLLATALTGVVYRVGRSWFGLPRSIAGVVISIHTGEFLGDPLVPFYVAIVGLSLIAMIATGLTMIRWRRGTSQKLTGRKIHRWLTPILFLPLAISAVTGIIYELGQDWFGLSPQQAAIFLGIHQGAYLGSFLRVVYVLLIGVGLVALLITGINMTGIFRHRRRSTET
ncbi:PepSY domain-containing protein [Microcoleus sp. FACHB-1515]|uniref:PepSY domain-containing protein n=1 Tax=Cyanophyceae TaxID=3028117 RepID=UPI00168357DD|nr:PepSY domain-containing protein [Microcoleus sp. FACHB-1515]MBD2090918.1 PepSY domain-containing protein [Microcoleus sp. FACHB-1515]